MLSRKNFLLPEPGLIMRELVNIPLVHILTLVAFSGTEKLPKGWFEQSCLLLPYHSSEVHACVPIMADSYYGMLGFYLVK